jgi:peptidyl-prolyl cis-trans isomerase SurA
MILNPYLYLQKTAADLNSSLYWRGLPAQVLLVTCALLLACLPARATEIVDRIVAVVNGQVITSYDLDRELAPYFMQLGGRKLNAQDEQQLTMVRKKLLARLVDDILLLMEAKRLNLEVTDTEVENHIRQFRQSNSMTEEDLGRQLQRENMTREEYKRNIRESMLRHRVLSYMVRRKVLVTDEEILRYYDEHRNDYVQAKKVELGLILLPPSEDLDGLVQRLGKSEISFEEAARKYSKGPGAQSGGSIGRLKWSELASQWREALAQIQPGEISEPFSIDGNKAILKLKAIIPGKERPLDEVREEIRQKLYDPKYAVQYAEYMQDLKTKAIVDIRF